MRDKLPSLREVCHASRASPVLVVTTKEAGRLFRGRLPGGHNAGWRLEKLEHVTPREARKNDEQAMATKVLSCVQDTGGGTRFVGQETTSDGPRLRYDADRA